MQPNDPSTGTTSEYRGSIVLGQEALTEAPRHQVGEILHEVEENEYRSMRNLKCDTIFGLSV